MTHWAVIVTDKPLPTRMTREQQEFYLEHENGAKLLKNVRNLAVSITRGDKRKVNIQRVGLLCVLEKAQEKKHATSLIDPTRARK